MSAILIIVIILLCSATASSSQLVPEQWIYDAVEYLNEHETLTSTQGIRSLNRYQVALAVADIIQSLDPNRPQLVQRFGVSRDVYLKDIVRQYNRSVDTEQRLSDEYVNVLSKLAVEFKEELVVLGYAVQDASELLQTDPSQKVLLASARNPKAILIDEQPKPSFSTSHFPVYFRDRYQYLYDMLDEEGFNKDITLNSQIPLSEDFVLGASLTLHETEEQLQVPGMAGLGGKYLVNNDLILEGQYLHNLDSPLGSGLFQLGATVKLGELELGGILRSLQSRLENEEPQSRAGYELSLRMGDLLVSTGRDPSNSSLGQNNSLYTTSVDLKYGMANSLLFSAGYQIESELKNVNELGNPSVTSLGLDIPIPQGKIKFGLTKEKALGYEDDSEPSLEPGGQGDLGSKQTALVGLSYALSNEADLKLNYYRLVNFDDLSSNSHDYTAEFSLRF